ncbi:MAG: hypothetical protein IT436_17095 [Phycisphaerales bacterium]|nr:hypothetical protein [Phycisphaerales bacterium]
MKTCCITACAVLFACAGTARAGEYFEFHDFTLKGITVRPGQTYRGSWNYYAHADEFHAPPTCTDEQTLSDIVLLPAGAGGQTITTRKLVCTPDAQANTQFSLGLDAMGHPTGHVAVWGNADVKPPLPPVQRAYAKSTSGLAVQTGTVNAKGQVRWKPGWRLAGIVSGDTRSRQSHDPILVSALDLDTGLLEETTLWDSMITIDGPGTSLWEDGLLQLDAPDGEFYITMDSPFLLSPRGMMRMTFAGGIITSVIDDGIWDGLLPAVGSPSTGIRLNLGDAEGAFDLDFDLGSTSAAGYDMTFDLSNEGQAFEEIPAPGAVLLLALAGVPLLARKSRE